MQFRYMQYNHLARFDQSELVGWKLLDSSLQKPCHSHTQATTLAMMNPMGTCNTTIYHC